MSAAVRTRSASSSSRRSDDSPATRAMSAPSATTSAFGLSSAVHSHAHPSAHGVLPTGSLLPPVLAGENGDVIHSVAHFSFSSGATHAGSKHAHLAETERLLPPSSSHASHVDDDAAAAAAAGAGGRRVSFSDGSYPVSGALLGSAKHGHENGHGKAARVGGSDGSFVEVVHDDDDDSAAKRRDVLLLGSIFLLCIAVVAALWFTAPQLPPADAAAVRLPRSMAQLRALVDVVTRYKGEHFVYVCALFAAVYVFLQMFAIPGAVFLSILAGPLFGLVTGMFVISTVATTGTSICYLLSSALGRRLVKSRFPDLLSSMQARVDAHRGSLLFYMLFLRVTPILPNWFINISSPIVGVPLSTFIIATFIGLMPGNYVHLSTGLALNSVAEDKPLMTPGTIVFLFVVGAIALLPLLFKKKLEAFDKAAVEGGSTGSVGANRV